MHANRLFYFLETALSAVRRAPSMAFLSAASVGMVLVMMGAFSMAVFNLERLTLVWSRAASMSCTLEASLPATTWSNIAEAVSHLDGVGTVAVISPQAALQRFAARGPEAQALVDGVDPSVLPASLELELAHGHLEMQHLQTLATKLRVIPGVESVDFGADVIARLRDVVRLLRVSGIGLGLALGAAVVFMLSNTIRLTVYARREEITILRLVGATSFFVRMPFLIEGALWGLGGGVLGTLALYSLHTAASARLTRALSGLTGGFELTFFSNRMALGMLGAGIALGVLGSALALRRFLDSEPA